MSTWQELKDNPRLHEMYRARTAIIRAIREFFWSRDFLETDTPLAVRFPGQEPYLNPVPVIFHDPAGAPEQFYLITSPEFALKKLLAAGYGKIFQITKCFRDFESFGAGTHNTEFTMIEWYRAPGTYFDFMDDAEQLFQYVAKKMGKESVVYNGTQCAVLEKWDRKTIKELWQEYINVNLDAYLERDALATLARTKGYVVSPADEYEDIFFKIFLNEIEPHLGRLRPLFVYEYPKQMCSLSRVSERDPRYAERAELYVAGLELANGFGELLDAAEQQKRLEADRTLRAKLGKETWPVDPDFITALPLVASSRGTAAGVAMGVDRMVLLFTGARDIREVIFQSIKDQLA